MLYSNNCSKKILNPSRIQVNKIVSMNQADFFVDFFVGLNTSYKSYISSRLESLAFIKTNML
jgi:hypothetical protein